MRWRKLTPVMEARRYDLGMRPLEKGTLASLRRRLLSDAAVRVLEIGAGTGANVASYRRDTVVVATDLRPGHLSVAADKGASGNSDARIVTVCSDAHDLPFPARAFDTVVGSLVFCSIARPESALAEIRRVLVPGGRLLLLEHVRGQTRLSRAVTDLVHPLWFALQHECRLNRETAAAVAAAGFEMEASSVHGWGFLQLIRAINPPR